MFNLFKKTVKEADQPDMTLHTARTKLAQARENNLTVIEIQARKMRNEANLSEDEKERAILSIKNAYYALSVIKIVESRLLEMDTHSQLVKGMNQLTEALELINRFQANAEKPQPQRFIRSAGKVRKSAGREISDMEDMEGAYTDTFDINEMVDDDVIRLVKEEPSERIWACVNAGKAIRTPYRYDTGTIDLSKLRDEGGMAVDIPSINLDDVRE